MTERNRDLKLHKIGRGALLYYKNNTRKAIADSFPEFEFGPISLYFFFSFNNILDEVLSQKRQRHSSMYRQ